MITPKEYIKQLEKSKNLAVDRFGNLTSLEHDVIDSSFEWLVSNLKIERGEFVVTDDLNQLMNQFVNAVIETVHNNATYQNSVSKYLFDLTQITTNVAKFQNEFNDISPKDVDIKPVQKALINETIDQFTENGLNANFVQPLRDLIFRNVAAGINLKDAKAFLQDYILSGKDKTGKLSRYVQQTAQQGVDSYAGAINTQLMKAVDFTGMIISGSLIETSSKQCVHAIELAKKQNGYLSNDQLEMLMKEARDNKKAPLIDGTDLENLPINKFHWGCRHEFTPIIKNKAS